MLGSSKIVETALRNELTSPADKYLWRSNIILVIRSTIVNSTGDSGFYVLFL